MKARQDLEEYMAVFKSVTHYSMALLKGCPWFICIGIEKSLFKNTLSTHLRHIESKYLKAIDLYNSGNKDEAFKIFKKLKNYKKSLDYTKKCKK